MLLSHIHQFRLPQQEDNKAIIVRLFGQIKHTQDIFCFLSLTRLKSPDIYGLRVLKRRCTFPRVCVRDIGTHGDCVDVRHMAGEGLPAHAIADVPQLGGGVTGS